VTSLSAIVRDESEPKGYDGTPPASRVDRLVPWVTAAVTFFGFFAVSMLRYHTLVIGFDIAYFRQATWLISRGEDPFLTVRGLHLLADHTYYPVFPISFLTRVLPAVPTLLALQAAGLAAAVLPLYAICRRLAGLGTAASGVVLISYALFPAIQNVNAFEFHPETVLAPVALLGAVLYAFTARWWPYAGCIALALLSREDLVVVVAGLSLLLALERRVRPALVTLGVAMAWGALNMLVIQASFPGGELVQAGRVQPYGDNLVSAAAFLATHPMTVVRALVTPDDVTVAVALLAPVLFLPLLAPRWLLPGLPLQLFYLVSAIPPAQTVKFQYTLAIDLFIFVATAMALGRSGQVKPDRAVLVTLLLASVLLNAHFGTASVFQQPWTWRTRDALDHARLEAARLVPDDVPVSATDTLLALLSERTFAYLFPPWSEAAPPEGAPVGAGQAHVRYIAVETTGELWTGTRQEALERLVEEGRFELVFSNRGVLVYRR
jgi:uncharacterized membrane protein